jgi:hypothetical protein
VFVNPFSGKVNHPAHIHPERSTTQPESELDLKIQRAAYSDRVVLERVGFLEPSTTKPQRLQNPFGYFNGGVLCVYGGLCRKVLNKYHLSGEIARYGSSRSFRG